MQPQPQPQQPSRQPAPQGSAPGPRDPGGPATPGGPGPGSGGFGGAGKWIAAAIGVVAALFAGNEIKKEIQARPQPQPQAQALQLGVEERNELGLPETATHKEIWAATRTKALPEIQLCAEGATVLVSHSMGAGDVASVNGVVLDSSKNGYQLFQLPEGTTQIAVTGLRSPNPEGIIFVIDTFTNGMLFIHGLGAHNSCNLRETHNMVAVRIGETLIVPIR